MSVLFAIRAILMALGGGVSWLLGGWDGAVIALVTIMAIDYASGVVRSIFERKLCSNIGLKGIAQKVLVLLLVGAAQIVDTYLLDGTGLKRMAVILFLISNEAVSALENFALCGLPIPAALRGVLLKFKHEREHKPENPKTHE